MEGIDVSVRLLGPVQVEVDGRPVASFRSHKTLAVLAFLVAEQRPVARNYLAQLFWPEASQADARGHLRRALHDLSQKARGILLTDYYTTEFNPALRPHTDLARLEALRQQTAAAELETAAAHCRGQFMEGITLTDCPEFETWLMIERETWLRKVTGVLEHLLQRYTQTLRPDLALEMAWRLLRLDPWREERYQQLMLHLARNGALEQAIKVYRRYRHMLATDLALEPSEEIESLYERLRQRRRRRPGNIPHSPTPLAGRSGELATLARFLVDPDCRLISLTGPSGYGRTRLAIEAAARANNPSGYLFLDGAFIVRLDSAKDQAQFLGRTAQALGIISGTTGATLDMVVRRLQGRETLLLLDGFDNLRAHKEMLVTLLDAIPALKLLVIGRERLRLPAERNVELRPFPHGPTVAPPDRQQTLLPPLIEHCIMA